MRSALFISANTPSMMLAAHAYDTDAIFYDLEDSVAPSDKRSARFLLEEHLKTHPLNVPSYVRINAVDHEAFSEDIAVLKRLNHLNILLPKASVQALNHCLKAYPKARIFALCETPEVFFELPELAKHPSVVGLMLGGEDLALALDTPKPTHKDALLFGRSQLLYAAKAYHKWALDTPYTHFQDDEGLIKDIDHAKRLGFDGKAAIHPSQLPLIQTHFSPSQEALDDARAIIDIHEKTNQIRFSYQGKMVDQPILTKAYRLLKKKDIKS